MSNLRGEQVQRSISWSIIGKTDFIRLVNEEDIGAAVPAPVSRLRAELALCNFDYLTRPTFLEHANHTATSRPTIHVNSQRSIEGIQSGLNKPEESVNCVILLNWCESVRWKCDITGVLLLSGEGCCTSANRRGFKADGYIAVNRRVYNGDIRVLRYW